MSEEFVNNWKPRRENVMRFKSGNACILRKPGPELAMLTGHLQRRLRALRAVSQDESGKPLDQMTEEEKEDAGLKALEEMTPEQRETSLQIMRITVAACVKFPRVYVDPKPGQTGVDDIDGDEFTAVWNWWASGCPDLPTAEELSADESEVSAADADRFPDEQSGGDGTSDNVPHVRGEAERVDEAA